VDDKRLTPRASVFSFVATSALATFAAVGLFVLMDPRAQAFWGARFGDLVTAVRTFFSAR